MVAQLWRVRLARRRRETDCEAASSKPGGPRAFHGGHLRAGRRRYLRRSRCAALVRDHVRLEKRPRTLEATTERLHDDVWELRDSEERYRSLVEGQDDLIYRRDDQRPPDLCERRFRASSPGGRRRRSSAPSTSCPSARPAAQARRGRLGSYDQAVETSAGTRWISWVETPVHRRPGGTRDPGRRPRRHRPAADRGRVGGGAAARRSRQRGQVALPGHRQPRDPHAAQRRARHGRPAARHRASTRAAHLCPRGQDLGRGAALDHRGDPRLLARSKPASWSSRTSPSICSSLVEGTVELLAPRAQGKDIEIASYIAPDVAPRLMGDAARLRQVLNNLAGNAVKFTDDGRRRRLACTADGDASLLPSRDTGIGIPADRVGGIFDEFEQVDGTASQPACRHRARPGDLPPPRRAGMGGEITVTSEPGRGSVFSFRPAVREGAGRRAGPLDRRRRCRADRADRLGLALRGAVPARAGLRTRA